MAQNRGSRGVNPASNPVVAVELLRQASKPAEETAGKDDKLPVFWRVCGSTLLSLAALVLMTAYQNIGSLLAEIHASVDHVETDVRKEITRLGEMQGDFVRTDEFEPKLRTVSRAMSDFANDQNDQKKLHARVDLLTEASERSEKHGKELRQELDLLRVQHAAEVERRALLVELTALRDRLADLETGSLRTVPRMRRIEN